MKTYIVSGRIDTNVLFIRVFKTREEAEQEVKDIIYESARQCYQYEDDAEDNPDWGTIETWAEDNGYEFDFSEDRGVFYSGSKYTKADITEHIVQ